MGTDDATKGSGQAEHKGAVKKRPGIKRINPDSPLHTSLIIDNQNTMLSNMELSLEEAEAENARITFQNMELQNRLAALTMNQEQKEFFNSGQNSAITNISVMNLVLITSFVALAVFFMTVDGVINWSTVGFLGAIEVGTLSTFLAVRRYVQQVKARS